MVSWDELINVLTGCRKCPLCAARTNVVVGMGNKNADVMFIGEAPGYYEDLEGLPFVGKAGQLLDKMLAAIDFDRDQVYIANIVKCRPPDNRDPEPSEQESCVPYLKCQILLIKPKIICCLDRISAKKIISEDFRITSDRGIWHEKNGYSIIATYHPSALLRDETKKRPAWEDFKAIRKKYDEINQKNLLEMR